MIIKPGYFAYDYCDERRARIDENNRQAIESGMQPEYVFFGDSITEGMPEDITGAGSVNNGIGGDRLNYMVERFTADVLQLQPQKVHILGGINDLMPWFRQEHLIGRSENDVIKYVTDHLHHMVQLARREDIEVLVGTILPLDRPGYDNDYLNTVIQKINTILRESQGNYQYKIVDYYPAFLTPETQQVEASFFDDGLHPNAKGYEQMFEVLYPLK